MARCSGMMPGFAPKCQNCRTIILLWLWAAWRLPRRIRSTPEKPIMEIGRMKILTQEMHYTSRKSIIVDQDFIAA